MGQRHFFSVLFCLPLLFLLSGCGLLQITGDGAGENTSRSQVEEERRAEWAGTPVPYKVTVAIREGSSPEKKATLKALIPLMEAASQLVQLKDEEPDSVLALERRARVDAETAVRLLHSQCYYEGQARFTLDQEASPVQVTLWLEPGPRYVLGRASVTYIPRPHIPQAFYQRTRSSGFWGLDTETLPPPQFPEQLPGVTPGKPIVADDLLKAVEKLPESLKRDGYPLARVHKAIYSLNPARRELNADVIVQPGPPACMGGVQVEGSTEVSAAYLQRLAPWDEGTEVWDEDLLQTYANTLRGLGLFRSVEVAPAKGFQTAAAAQEGEAGMGVQGTGENAASGTAAAQAVSSARGGSVPDSAEASAGILPVHLKVSEATFRTVSGSLRYDTDTGFGLEADWEHRNILGNGEKLSLAAPLATEKQGLMARFEKPAFLSREQRLLAHAAFLREELDSYKVAGGRGGAGIERRFSRQWYGGIGLSGEGGSLKDNDNSRAGYGLITPTLSLRRDSRDNILNPTSGSEVVIKLEPFSGYYHDAFTAMAGRVTASFYYAPFTDKQGKDSDALVLAARLGAGSISGAALDSIPSTKRYYAGGADTVRGYGYQALGPRDSKRDPLGGRSYQTVNLEARFKITDSLGLVPFVDGGNVYREEVPPIFGPMDWAAGLGLRYFTPIGPLRLDVAMPLRQIRDDPPVQLYISIGQSF